LRICPNKRILVAAVVLTVVATIICSSCKTGKQPPRIDIGLEWPMYLHDHLNSGKNETNMRIPKKKIWEKRIREPEEKIEQVTIPIVYRGKVFFYGQDGFIRALYLGDGSEAWNVGPNYGGGVAPCGNDGKVFFEGGFIYAGYADKNKEVWVARAGGGVTTPLVSFGDRLYYGTNSGYLYSISVINGRAFWKTKLNGLSQVAPCVAQGKVFIPSGGGEEGDQRVYCVDTKKGNILWESNIPGNESASSIVYENERVYFGDDWGVAFCLDANNGNKIWSSELGDTLETPVLLGDKIVFAGLLGSIRCLDKHSGQILWSISQSENITTPIVATRSFAVFGTEGGNLKFIDPNSGESVHDIKLPGKPVSIAVAKDRIVVGTEEGSVICLGR